MPAIGDNNRRQTRSGDAREVAGQSRARKRRSMRGATRPPNLYHRVLQGYLMIPGFYFPVLYKYKLVY